MALCLMVKIVNFHYELVVTLFLPVAAVFPDRHYSDRAIGFLKFRDILSAIYFLEEMDNSMLNKRMIWVEFRRPKTVNKSESDNGEEEQNSEENSGGREDSRRRGKEDNRGRRDKNNSPRTADVQREYHIQRSE
jgi:RNA recognition motif-containing protein